MEEYDDEELAEAYQEAIAADKANLHKVMNELIDSVSKFMSIDTTDYLTNEDFAKMLLDLDTAKFIVSGVMYLHGKPLCGHDHESEDDDCE